MRRILIPTVAALGLLLAGGERTPQASGARAAGVSADASLDELLAADCVDDAAMTMAQAARRLPQEGGVASDSWPPNAIGGLIPPIRSVSDPFPTFDGIAIDTENNRVGMLQPLPRSS